MALDKATSDALTAFLMRPEFWEEGGTQEIERKFAAGTVNTQHELLGLALRTFKRLEENTDGEITVLQQWGEFAELVYTRFVKALEREHNVADVVR